MSIHFAPGGYPVSAVGLGYNTVQDCKGTKKGEKVLNVLTTGLGVAGVVGTGMYFAKHPGTVTNAVNKVKSVPWVQNATNKVGAFVKNSVNKFNATSFGQGVKNKMANITPYLKNGVTKAKGFFSNICQSLSKLPKTGKFAIGAALVAIVAGGIHKAGKIDQKYS